VLCELCAKERRRGPEVRGRGRANLHHAIGTLTPGVGFRAGS
jgi:hypothetical protein